ncbi:DUF4139 domain-containing protein [Novosphingobium sp. TH158]|uniref:DUF4139 domain-containing protein n=1 Tax=Novosphingobium sp. TH158 TaxID=2067455 RepID=UPI000C7BE9CE|nr:hypothetical protein [Novosphingobium sp. TH158]PLK24389.1 hypothetical protein C0V78_14135 [Novosphingobium sp. TH158]
MRRLIALFAALLPAAALAERPVVASAAPGQVAVTIYRDPQRAPGKAIYKARPGAFALIAETREVDLPPGEVVLRFEGVAGGIVPQSAILFGTGPREKNRDAALLSQKGLVDAFTGQSVILRRTDPATGKVSEEHATVRSAAQRLVVTTSAGSEAVYCSGLNQTLLYPEAPATLSAKPVLTMTTKDQPGGRTTVTLAYIATGFDWDATYVATLAEDGKSMALLSWLTMASGDETSFPDAATSAVAGEIARSEETRDDTSDRLKNEARWLNKWADCWPAGRTHQISLRGVPLPPPPPPGAPMMAMSPPMERDIVVSGMRKVARAQNVALAVTAKSESLGDLKLYRIPIPVTVAARSQKQVAFLNAPRVRGELVYRSKVYGAPEDPQMLFRFRNRKDQGLGDPLPAGKVVVYQDGDFGRQVVGETSTGNKAVDEEVEFVFGEPTGVTVENQELADKAKRSWTHTVTLRNANPFAIRYEMEFPAGDNRTYTGLPGKLIRKPGKQIWAMTLAPGSETKLVWRSAEVAGE